MTIDASLDTYQSCDGLLESRGVSKLVDIQETENVTIQADIPQLDSQDQLKCKEKHTPPHTESVCDSFAQYPICPGESSFGNVSMSENGHFSLSDISVGDICSLIADSVQEAMDGDLHGTLKSGFLNTSTAVNHLLKKCKGIDQIPVGIKENVYYVMDNNLNLENRSNKKRSTFSDDCGVWDSSTGASPKSYYLLHDNGDLTLTFLKNGLYCHKKRVNKKTEYLPMTPQPDKNQIVVIHRYYATLKASEKYNKRVTWLGEGGLESTLALVEYIGQFPGLASHGLSQKQSFLELQLLC